MIYIFLFMSGSMVSYSGEAETSLAGSCHVIVQGYLKDVENGYRISGAHISIDGLPRVVTSNGEGGFLLRLPCAEDFSMMVSYIGYKPVYQRIEVNGRDTLELVVEMTFDLLTLDGVQIVGRQGIRDVTGSVAHMSMRELERFNYTDPNRALRNIPGVNIQDEDGFGLRPSIGLRGTGVERNTKITVMEDGVLIAPAPYAAPAAYYFPTFGRLEGVEVLKGSSQIKYGPYTTGGAINLISTRIPESLAGRVRLWGGSHGTRNLHAWVGDRHEHVSYLVETFQFGSNGFKQLDGGGNTGFSRTDYQIKLGFHTRQDARIFQSLTLRAGQVDEVSDETYLGLTRDDFRSNPLRRYRGSQMDQLSVSHNLLTATHFVRFSQNLDLTTTVYHTSFERNWYKLDHLHDTTGKAVKIDAILDQPDSYPMAYRWITGDENSGADALTVRANNRSYASQGVQSVLRYTWVTRTIEHSIDYGVRVHSDMVDRFQWDDSYRMHDGVMMLTSAGIPGTESNRVERADAVASYVQYAVRFGKVLLTPGVRYENITMQRDDYGRGDPERVGEDLKETGNEIAAWMPGIGFRYFINRNLTLVGGVHKGFAPPGSREGAKPEESVSYELGARFERRYFRLHLVAFANDYANLLGSDLAASGGTGSGDLFNGGEVFAHGLEVSSNIDILALLGSQRHSTPVTVAYTYTSAEFKNTFESDFKEWGSVTAGDQFPYLAKHQLSMTIGWEYETFGVHVASRFVGAMRTAPGQGEIPENQLLNPYQVLDVGATWRTSQKVHLFTTITNIANATYVVAMRPAGLRPGMPRNAQIGIRAQF